MIKDIRFTIRSLKLLSLLLKSAQGLEASRLIKESKTGAGTIYSILKNLEENGWITSKLITKDNDLPGRPKQIYKLTVDGKVRAQEIIAYVVG